MNNATWRYMILRHVMTTGACKPWRSYYVGSRKTDEPIETADLSGVELIEQMPEGATYENALLRRAEIAAQREKDDALWREAQPVSV